MNPSLLNASSEIELKLSSKNFNIPNGILGLWSLQTPEFQRDNDIFTVKGLISCLGWFIHDEQYHLEHHPYLIELFSQEFNSFHKILVQNVVEHSTVYIPFLFYSIYLFRLDLKQTFDLSVSSDLFAFFNWILSSGYDEYSDKKILKVMSQELTIYRHQYFDQEQIILNGYAPSASDFNKDWYLSQYPDVKAALLAGHFESAKDHWIQFGKEEGRVPVPYPSVFDEEWYLNQYPDVKAAVLAGHLKSAKDHWVKFGRWEEARVPVPCPSTFDEDWYLNQYPDVQASISAGHLKSAEDHWVKCGRKEGRMPVALKLVDFDLVLCSTV
ncbi:MAG: hypothetical protein AAFN42_01585 [Cyanobacteria bacterium J06554_1]